jgi:Icc protein
MKAMGRKEFLKCLGFSSLTMLASRTIGNNQLNLPPTNEPFRVAHLTDIHVESGKASEEGFKACLISVNNLTNKPNIIINGGDAIMNEALTFSQDKINHQWSLFKNILEKNNSLPIHHCIGNHDLCGWPNSISNEKESKDAAINHYDLTNAYYSITYDKWKFIVLDSIRAKSSIPGYYAELDTQQMSWLIKELEVTPKETYICIVSHVPILAVCPLFDSVMASHRNIPKSVLHADSTELVTLFYKFPNIKACLSGHIHLIDHVNYLGIDYFCNGAVSGAWWKGKHHQFPPSYSIMNFYNDGKVSREIHYYNWE